MRVRSTSSLNTQKGFYPFFGVNRPFDPEFKFVTARFISPKVFGLLRLSIAIYGITTIIVDIILTGIHPPWTPYPLRAGVLIWVAQQGAIDSYFSYFTDITFISLTFYFIFAAGHTLWYARTGSSPLNRWYRPFQLGHTVLYTTIITYPILVTIVFWTLLAGGGTLATTRSRWSNISKHALNSVFAIFEIIFSAVGTQPWSHLIFIVLFLGMPSLLWLVRWW